MDTHSFATAATLATLSPRSVPISKYRQPRNLLARAFRKARSTVRDEPFIKQNGSMVSSSPGTRSRRSIVGSPFSKP